eukprot:384829_1
MKQKNVNNNEAYFDPDFVKQIYELIANFFVPLQFAENKNDEKEEEKKEIYSPSFKNERKTTETKNSELFYRQNGWICANCHNENFNLKHCLLCSISRIDAIVLKIRNWDTLKNITDENENNAVDQDEKNDEIDALIAQAIQSDVFDLRCTNQNNNQQCQAFKRLAKYLIIHKRARKGTDDIIKFINNEIYIEIFVECASNLQRITENDLKLIKKMIDDNRDDFGNINTFINMKSKQFG